MTNKQATDKANALETFGRILVGQTGIMVVTEGLSTIEIETTDGAVIEFKVVRFHQIEK